MSTNEAPLPNSPDARTTDGTLQDQQTQNTNSTETKPNNDDQQKPGTSLLNQDDEKKPEEKKPEAGKSSEAQPLKLEDIKAPEGFEINKEAMEAALPVFNELGINSEGATKLLALYQQELTKAEEAPYEAWNNMRAEWQKEIKTDPKIGPRISEVKANLGGLYDAISATEGGAQIVKEFKEVMDLTGAGDNIRFVRLFDRVASLINEGKHVSGRGPSEHGQHRSGTAQRPTGAQAMYPNLPSSSRNS